MMNLIDLIDKKPLQKEKIHLGSFSTDSYIEQTVTVQYKIRSNNTLLSSGTMQVAHSLLPDKFKMSPAYPNPFNPRTTVKYELPIDSELNLSVYDIQGRLVTHLSKGFKSAGYYETIWDASQYSSGIYFIQIQVYDTDRKNNFESMQKIMLVK